MTHTSTHSSSETTRTGRTLVHRHLLAGWAGLFVFALLGLILEGLLAWKVQAYVNLALDTRRLMWRLAHAHGAMLALLHVAAAFTFSRGIIASATRAARLASGCLIAASWLIPGGFFLGGLDVEGGDPGSGIALVPAGAVLLLCALALLCMSLWRSREDDGGPPDVPTGF